MNRRISTLAIVSALICALVPAAGVPAPQHPPAPGSGMQGLYRSVRKSQGLPAPTPRRAPRDLPPIYDTRKQVRSDSPRPTQRGSDSKQTRRTVRTSPPARQRTLPVRSPRVADQRKAAPNKRKVARSGPHHPPSQPQPTSLSRRALSKQTTGRKQSQRSGPSAPDGERNNARSRTTNEQNSHQAARPPRRERPSGFPTTLEPTPKGGYRYRAPNFYEGIYITNPVARTERLYGRLLDRATKAKLNTLVVDVQPRLPKRDFIRRAREAGFYLVARVVVFEGGLKRYPPTRNQVERPLMAAERAAKNGFMEVQLDYIRFADRYKGRRYLNLSLKSRYRLIEGILKMATDRLRPHGVRVGADIFGRIAFNRNDIIGQKVELFAAHLDTLYPMLYPSHFYGEPRMIRNPYRTILLGKRNTIRRSQGAARVIAYIQGFRMSVRPSGLSYVDYIRKQIAAAEDSGGAGYIVWNARNRYGSFFRALDKHRKLRRQQGLTHNERRVE